jgi:hypothetical protein
VQVDPERWLNSVARLVVLVFFGGVLLTGAPSEWLLAVHVLYIAGIVACWMIWMRQRFRKQ